MKRITGMILILSMLLVFASCGNKSENKTAENDLTVKASEISSETASEAAEEAVKQNQEEITESVTEAETSAPEEEKLPETKAEALAYIDSADFIISKGQANWETLTGLGYNIYYIMLTKCDMIAEKMASVKSIDQAKAMKEYNVITDSIKHVSFNAPAAVMMTGASEPALSGKVAGVAKGQFAGPVKGNGGVYVFQVYNTEKSEEQYDEKSEMQMLGMTAMQNSMRVVMSELMMNSKIEDNRYMYF